MDTIITSVLAHTFFGGHPHNTKHMKTIVVAMATYTPTTTSTTAVPVPTAPSMYNMWVINLSTAALTPVQEALLAQGTKLHTSPKVPPRETYITAVEEACTRLPPGKAEELRVETSHLLKKNCHPPKPSISLEEKRQSGNLKKTNLGWY